MSNVEMKILRGYLKLVRSDYKTTAPFIRDAMFDKIIKDSKDIMRPDEYKKIVRDLDALRQQSEELIHVHQNE